MSVDGLTSAVAALSRTATGQFTVVELLRQLVDLAAIYLPVDGAGVMIAEPDRLEFVHASRGEVDHVEQLQALLQQGPCQQAVRQLEEVVVPDLAAAREPEWRAYLAGAAEVGLGAVVAVPLVSRGRAWGVLDLYRRSPGPWTESELAAARLLADVAVSYVVMAADRDQAREAQRELAHRSTHDALTGLPNRALLFDRLEHALTAAARRGSTVAVFFLDLDRFKDINDRFGHAAGDWVLVQVGRRLCSALRAEDTVARLAGDEFVVICEQLDQRTAAELTAQVAAVSDRIRAAFVGPMRLDGAEVTVGVSIGVALSDGHSTVDDLLASADAAMYRLKQQPQAGLIVRDHAGGISRRRQLERDLRGAQSAGELQVHYQPIVASADRSVRAVEALLRWQHPRYGLLPAGQFIEIAASTGLIVPIGHWLIDRTCGQLARWRQQLGPRAAPGTAYVNLSARELCDPALPDVINAALRRHGLDPHQLGLELLEESFIEPDLVPALENYANQGHPLSVDDFGTGYSSLSRLIGLPVALAKIDRAFVAGAGHDRRRRAFIDAVLVIARSLNLLVIGEGVETEDQARQLTDAGCPLLQGFHLGRPQPGDALTASWAA